ncbi:unnamed protein product [Chondrus crispus]|uniref:Uncharacterized protein n=1 Tax=Chondrus crispus TaxID=2769 RepID=R7Q5F0_CHOCR|nr:unnamed protein product [Chondrus crispus]CDF33772.1 unnamed protein product [Chondrus crispus]|eukprot:XP_005713591.1 unnamed protein product [Chondrus crispus]
MGQEQSIGGGNVPASSKDAGVHRVEGTGQSATSSQPTTKLDQVVAKSSSLNLPQQILPPPRVKDEMPSALQGTLVMHELNRVFHSLLMGVEETPNSRVQSTTLEGTEASGSTDGHGTAGTPGQSDGSNVDGDGRKEEGHAGNNVLPERTSIDDLTRELSEDSRAEQNRWARLGIDEATVSAVLEQCTGGPKMASVLNRQALLLQQIMAAKEKSVRLNAAMEKHGVAAKRTTMALERLDRIHIALSDVQDNLESAVATANILGASHFSHDDEMCSFKNFLRHNPPKYSKSER